jgi:thiol-disulfide isomerase/thioredoxin
MSYYAEEYNNNGMDKAAMRIYYNSLAAVTTSNLLVTVNYAKPYENEFSYWIYDEDGVINANNIDYAEAVPDSFLITGSQIGGENNNTQKVLVELGTGIWCSNCPYAEAALHILKEELGDQFYYIEYHINDVLQVDGNLEILSYYGDTTLPIAKFQGQTTLSHNQEATVDYYRNALNIYLAQEAKAFLTNQSVSMSEDILTGEVDISLEDIETTNLFLKYSLVEKESDKTNFAGENCLQVVLANGSMSLENADLTQPVTYNLDLPAYLPEDIVLYLWLQTLDEPYDEETCKVHNIIEVNL